MDVTNEKSSKELSEVQKWAVVAYSNFFRNAESLELDHGSLSLIAGKFNVTQSRVKHICRQYSSQYRVELYPHMRPKKKGRVGRK
jgi:hypothetical protein